MNKTTDIVDILSTNSRLVVVHMILIAVLSVWGVYIGSQIVQGSLFAYIGTIGYVAVSGMLSLFFCLSDRTAE